jgi:hypothetical protein
MAEIFVDDLLSLLGLMWVKGLLAIHPPSMDALGEMLQRLRRKELFRARNLIAVERRVSRGFIQQRLSSKIRP